MAAGSAAIIAAALLLLTAPGVKLVLAFIYVLLLPGYVLSLLLGLPHAGFVGSVAYSFGLSVPISVGTGFALIYSHWGLRAESLVPSLLTVILVLAGLGFLRSTRRTL